MEDAKYFLDAQTRDGRYRTTLFVDEYTEAIKDFISWAKVHDLEPKDLWYADIFSIDGKHEATVELTVDKLAKVTLASPDSKLNPFRRRHRSKLLVAIFGQ